MQSTENANSESHYKILVVAIFIGLVGVFLRFAGDENSTYFSWIANALMIVAIGIGLKTVFAIMK